MESDVQVRELVRRVDELEKEVEQLSRAPLSRMSFLRRTVFGVFVFAVAFGGLSAFLDHFELRFGGRPYKVEADVVRSGSLELESDGDSPKRWGSVDGKSSRIELTSDSGSVHISPRGIEIEGEDGTLSLKPEKKK
ncbi:MAG: hypothetical protein KDB82_07480 [Planctomycetes bacterium]|nr:hypothetical protein [Planctomycetota bacterium]